MAVSCPISQENPSPVFGLPANLCKLCPQYNHVIIFPRRCYNEMQCPVPAIFYRLKTRAGKAGRGYNREAGVHSDKVECGLSPTQHLDAMQVSKNRDSEDSVLIREVEDFASAMSLSVGELYSRSNPAPAPDSHNLPVLIHGMKTAETAAHSPTLVAAQNFPQVLDQALPPIRRPANLFRRFLAWAWSKSAFNDPTREMTCFGWRRRQ